MLQWPREKNMKEEERKKEEKRRRGEEKDADEAHRLTHNHVCVRRVDRRERGRLDQGGKVVLGASEQASEVHENKRSKQGEQHGAGFSLPHAFPFRLLLLLLQLERPSITMSLNRQQGRCDSFFLWD